MSKFYDGTKLLSLKDLNGDKPELYIVTSNRSGGKTTYFGKYRVNRFLKNGEKFALLYRYNYELDDCADKFFKDLSTLFFNGKVMTSKRRASGIFHELFLDGVSCGYALSLNSADQLKKYSHLLSDISAIIFDEFQSESNRYCTDEVKKFISIHTSIARGQGEQSRYVPVYMISNPVSIINPYYIELGISERLRHDTKFLRGVGFVLEQGFNESASNALKSGGFNKAFANNSYIGYSTDATYLNDNKSFIEPPTGKGDYLATIKYEGVDFAIRQYTEQGIIYCDTNADLTYPRKITVSTGDHEVNYVMLQKNSDFIKIMRWYFEKGAFRFKDLRCKGAILKALSY